MISRVSIVLLVIALLALAGLQYHWIGEISVAERQRLEASVRDSSNRFAADFANEIRSLTNALDIRGGEPDAADIASRYRGWANMAANPELLRSLYLVSLRSSGPVHVSRMDFQSASLQPISWPANLIPLQAFLQRDSLDAIFRPNSNPARALPRLEGNAAVLISLGGGRPPKSSRGGEGPGPGPGFDRGDWRGGREGERGNAPNFPQQFPQLFQERNDFWLLAELDDATFTRQIFPALVARDFPMTDDQDYRVAVVSTSPASHTIFSTGKVWTAEDLSSPDYSIDLIGGSGGGSVRTGGRGPGPGPGGPPGPSGIGPGGRGGPSQTLYLGQGMRLLVKHESGSLETAVSNLRRRNLAVSFGILLVLGLGAGVVIVSGQRARTLGRLQMEFAAGVSHELRTPLAVIQSAAHNLRAGVVRDREGIEEYAIIVQKEARRLSGMVEQVMTYAETQSGRKRYDIAPVDLNTVVDRALQNMAIPLSDANATIESRIDPQLAPAMGDEVALTQCVQNLLSNALKYGSAADTVQIEIESEVDRESGSIRLSVIDHGPGVPAVDERHLFDPFHRGSNAATNTPGNGLGLHLVQRIMESQKGSVAYKRAAGGGACFTLTLPAAGAGV